MDPDDDSCNHERVKLIGAALNKSYDIDIALACQDCGARANATETLTWNYDWYDLEPALWNDEKYDRYKDGD